MKKEHIGIITVHKNVNYGANLQAFASCKLLSSIYVPDSVITIGNNVFNDYNLKFFDLFFE